MKEYKGDVVLISGNLYVWCSIHKTYHRFGFSHESNSENLLLKSKQKK